TEPFDCLFPRDTTSPTVMRNNSARSCTPSPLKSPTASYALDCTAKESGELANVPSPLPSATVIDVLLLIAKSDLPSLLKSPITTDCGAVSVAAFGADVNPLPGRAETVCEIELLVLSPRFASPR